MKAKDYRAYKKSVADFLTRNDVQSGCFGPATPESEPHFSKQPCECCKRPLEGNREGYTFAVNRGGKFIASICPDCVYFLTYDCLDDTAMEEVKATRFEEVSNEDFERILTDLVSKMGAASVLSYGDVRTILGEELNNDVLEAWERENPL